MPAYDAAQIDAAADLLALLIEAEAKRTTREVTRTVSETVIAVAGQTEASLSDKLTGVQEAVAASQREAARVGRELVRAGATLEALQRLAATTAPALDQLRDALKGDLAREYARERQQRKVAESAAVDDILAALDGLERSLEAGRDVAQSLRDATAGRLAGVLGGVESLIEGLELTYRRLQDSLARRGVSPITAEGKPFDPHLHEAVERAPCAPDQDGIVLREERRGYRSAERVIRLAQVVVGRTVTPSEPVSGFPTHSGRDGQKRSWPNSWLKRIGIWPSG